MRWVTNTTLRPFYRGEWTDTVVEEAGWAPGPVWMGAGNLAFTEIRCADHPVHSMSLYRLRYPNYTGYTKKVIDVWNTIDGWNGERIPSPVHVVSFY
jgi:hypothetical protein